MAAKKICFFLTPIGDVNSPQRARSDQIKKFILNEVLSGTFKVIRADELPHPGSITHQIIRLLNDADLVIADLTGLNPNVIYELAVRHALNKPAIQLVDSAAKIPFDLKDERTVEFDLNDLDSVDKCKEILQKNLEWMKNKKFEYASPVFRVLGVAAATQQDKEGFLESIASQIDSLSIDVNSIEASIDHLSVSDVSDDVEKLEETTRDISRDIYDIKLDIRKLLERTKSIY
jgi:nucleoside 2-deoxyribosyltransferase